MKTQVVVTCVYCGREYPEGTPTSQVEVLTDHIKVCEKHPMREAEVKIAKLRAALVGLVGASTQKELDQMEVALRLIPGPSHDRSVALDAIQVLRETL